MSKKGIYLSEIKHRESVKISLMVMRILFRDNEKVVCILADKTGEVKANIIKKESESIKEGDVLKVEGNKDRILEVKKFKVLSEYDERDYLPHVEKPIEEIMKEIDEITDKYIVSSEARALNDYFFKNHEFLEKFKRGIGGVSMHHNYIGGLAEHTLNVMYLTSILCERYNCRRPETAILAAKLHDIGKIKELYYDGPFKYTLIGEMEGHIVIGVQMIDEAVNKDPKLYSEDFIVRIKGCITQHHGKLEYGSPREMKTEESYIVNYADGLDATMNKITMLKEKTKSGTWSEYDKRLETKLYL